MATFKDYAEEDIDPRFGGKAAVPTSGRRPIYKLNNRSPMGGDFTPGITMKEGEKSEVVSEVRAVVLMHSRTRFLWSKTGLLCGSDDGQSPSARIEKPKCQAVTAAQVAEVLSQFKGFDRARIVDLTDKLTENTGKLQMCGVAKSDGGCIPICTMGKRDERGPAPCKENLYLACYDIDRKRQFTMRLSGGSIRKDKGVTAPVWNFLARLGQQSVPCYAAAVTITPLQHDSGFYVANFAAEEPLDESLRDEMKALAHKELEAYERRASSDFKPKDEGLVAKDAPQSAATQVFGEDDIDFGE